MRTRIFIDGGDTGETRDIIQRVGFLDGQMTNPTLIAKNPEAKKRITAGRRFSKKEVLAWIPNAHMKFPTSWQGLKAAELSVSAGLRVNMTRAFSQEQAAAVYGGTRGAKKGQYSFPRSSAGWTTGVRTAWT